MNPLKQDLILRFIRAFLPAITHAHQYTTAHPLTLASINSAYDYLREAIGEDEGMPLLFVDDRIVVNREPLEDSLYSGRFIQLFRSRGIHHLHLQREISLQEMTAFVEVFTVNPKSLVEKDLFPHLRFGKVGVGYNFDAETCVAEEGETEPVTTVDSGNGDGGSEEQQKAFLISQQFKAIHEQDTDVMIGVYDAFRNHRNLPDREIRMVVADIISAIRQGSTVLLNFSPVRVLDEYTFTHSTNVCILTTAQAMALKMKDDLLHDIGVAAMLHDVGKISIPDEILNKPGGLTEREWECVRKHPQRGAEYLVNKPGIPSLAAIVAYEHHMLHDYSGYPKVSPDWRQNFCSRMTAISDFFDALRSKRVYRDSVEMTVICEQMNRMAGNILEPFLTRNFLSMVTRMFPGVTACGGNDR